MEMMMMMMMKTTVRSVPDGSDKYEVCSNPNFFRMSKSNNSYDKKNTENHYTIDALA